MKREDTTMNTNTMNSSTVETNNAAQLNASDIIPGTDWTYGDAFEMAVECRRDDRTARALRTTTRRRRSNTTRSAAFKASFFKATGWLWNDAVSESEACALETRSR